MRGSKRAAQILEVAFEVVVLLAASLSGREAGLADRLRPVVDAFRALLVEHVRGSHRVGCRRSWPSAGIALLLGLRPLKPVLAVAPAQAGLGR